MSLPVDTETLRCIAESKTTATIAQGKFSMKRLPLTFSVTIAVFVLLACKENPMSEENKPVQLLQAEIDCSNAEDKMKCEQLKRTSKSLKELSEFDANKLIVTCDDKFRNEFGECEIPNHPHPKELIKKDKEKDQDKDN